MPNEGSLKRSLQRLRRRDNPPLPSSLEELENIPERYQSINGARWLLHDSVGRDNRFLLFGRTSAINQMSRSRMWYMDGTFKSRPLLFAQLYVIHYRYQEHVIPGMFVLMERKTELAYLEVFRTVQQQLPDDHRQGSEHFSVDFELGSANAFKNVFDDASEDFCFFHFCQSM